MIVTPEGLNVFPEDVERVLAGIAGVRDVAVVGQQSGSQERVHAVLVLDEGVDPQAVVREANAQLLDHQKVRGVSVWPSGELPRTDGTRKLKRREIHAWVARGAPPVTAAEDASVAGMLAHYASGRSVGAATTIDELGLSSLDRVELMVALEEKYQTSIDETAFANVKSVADLEALVREPASEAGPAEPVEFPSWNRRRPIAWLRRGSLATWILPLARVFAWIRVHGREHLDHLDGPVVFAANHQSHIDTPVVLAAMPGRVRAHVAVAMAKEFFKAHFFPAGHSRRERFTNGLNYYLAAAFFNAFPLPQREAGARQTLRYIGELLADGWSVLIFPEGRRSENDELLPFRPGIGMIGSRLQVPVVPVRIQGAVRVLPPGASMARPGRVTVTFGAPLRLEGEDYAALAKRVEEAVRRLAKDQ
jgi:long-chain acyl-CoA synthetase